MKKFRIQPKLDEAAGRVQFGCQRSKTWESFKISGDLQRSPEIVTRLRKSWEVFGRSSQIFGSVRVIFRSDQVIFRNLQKGSGIFRKSSEVFD